MSYDGVAKVTVTLTAEGVNEDELRQWLGTLLHFVGIEVHAADDGHRYRDAGTGEFTTASDNAGRPGEIVEENGP